MRKFYVMTTVLALTLAFVCVAIDDIAAKLDAQAAELHAQAARLNQLADKLEHKQ